MKIFFGGLPSVVPHALALRAFGERTRTPSGIPEAGRGGERRSDLDDLLEEVQRVR